MADHFPNRIGASLDAVIFDCQDPQALATFYARFLGGRVEADPYGGYSVIVADRGLSLGFQADEHYERPVWLGKPREQQPMLHLDIKVRNRQEAADYALSLGAQPAEQVCRPEWPVQWTTLLDPAGHPFCLFDATGQ